MVLTGAGDKVFCAGADLGGFAADAPLVEKHFASDLFLDFSPADAEARQALALRSQRPCARGRHGAGALL